MAGSLRNFTSTQASIENNKNTYIKRESAGAAVYDIQQTVGASNGTGGGASVSVQDTAPTSPNDGDMWYDTNTANLYVYSVDVTGWMQIGDGGAGGSNVSSSSDGEAPADATNGDLWYDETTGTMYIYLASLQGWTTT